ncbi:MAG: flagellar basal body-associated FliL family protein [Paracoccaceae bacterium]
MKILPVVMGLVGVGAGIGAGKMLTPGDSHAAEAKADDHGAKKKADKDHAKADKKNDKAKGKKADQGHGDDGYGIPEQAYVKMANQFVIPIVERERVASMVVLSLSLEVQPGTEEQIYALEPKLRDSFLQVLFDHANMGGFQGNFTTSEMMDVLRGSLHDIAEKELGDAIEGVLIQDIVRQDV